MTDGSPDADLIVFTCTTSGRPRLPGRPRLITKAASGNDVLGENQMHTDIGDALTDIFNGITKLQNCCKAGRRFTIDGRLVGDIGELIAAREFDITLDPKSRALHDAITNTNRRDVQIKATFKNHLSLGRIPDLYLGLKLNRDGSHEVIFNGPGQMLSNAFSHRKNCGQELISFHINTLRQLNGGVKPRDRVPVRK